MKAIYNSVIFILLIVVSLSAYAQDDCFNYHEENCRFYGGWDYLINSQSRSALFSPGQSSSFSIIVYEGLDYHISICGHKKLGKFGFKIREDSQKKDIIYDNAREDFSMEVVFSVENTRKLIIEVTSLAEAKSGNKPRCLGVLIEHKKSPETGF